VELKNALERYFEAMQDRDDADLSANAARERFSNTFKEIERLANARFETTKKRETLAETLARGQPMPLKPLVVMLDGIAVVIVKKGAQIIITKAQLEDDDQ
jgi:hypothetical protein